MIRRPMLACFLFLPALVACPTREGELDTEGVGIARYEVAYNAQLGVLNYSGPARFTISGGALPDGLGMDAAGRILGTPAYAGVHRVEVTVTGLRGLDDFTGAAEIDVRYDRVESIFLGVERNWLNNFFHDPPFGEFGWGGEWYGQGPDGTGMYDPWTRVAEGGIDDTHTVELDFGIYLPGDNDRDDGGGLDDVRIADVAPSALTVILDDFVPVPNVDSAGEDYPSRHYAEGDDPVYDTETGVFTAGVDTGTLRASFSIEGVESVLDLRLQVSAPDWCPDGLFDIACEP
jgi:hypothetical protein